MPPPHTSRPLPTLQLPEEDAGSDPALDPSSNSDLLPGHLEVAEQLERQLDVNRQTSVKTSGIGYTVVKSVNVSVPLHPPTCTHWASTSQPPASHEFKTLRHAQLRSFRFFLPSYPPQVWQPEDPLLQKQRELEELNEQIGAGAGHEAKLKAGTRASKALSKLVSENTDGNLAQQVGTGQEQGCGSWVAGAERMSEWGARRGERS